MGLCDFGKLLNANDYDMREWFMISGFGQLMFIIAYYLRSKSMTNISIAVGTIFLIYISKM